jgi:hypothetical protein
MYRRITKHHTNVNEHHNALNALDHQAFEVLQSALLVAPIKQHHIHKLLMAAFALDLQEDEDALFMLCLLSYQSKTCRVSVILTINFFFMTIFPKQRVPRPLSAPVNLNICFVRPILVLPLHQIH